MSPITPEHACGSGCALPPGVQERRARIEDLGIPFEALPDLLQTTEAAIQKWIAGAESVEEADIIEVALSMLEVRLARVMARRIA